MNNNATDLLSSKDTKAILASLELVRSIQVCIKWLSTSNHLAHRLSRDSSFNEQLIVALEEELVLASISATGVLISVIDSADTEDIADALTARLSDTEQALNAIIQGSELGKITTEILKAQVIQEEESND
jgi:hypothetical protein